MTKFETVRKTKSGKTAWDAVPQRRKDNLERFLAAHRKNPLGPTLR